MRSITIEEGFFGTLFAAGGWVALAAVTQSVVPLFTSATLRFVVGLL
jgi:hypothetical protein